MGIGKFLISSILCLCSALALADGPPSAGMSVRSPNMYQGNPIGALAELISSKYSHLDDDDKQLYVRSIMIALEQTQNGEIVEWWSRRNTAYGKTRIISTYPTGGGYCRVYQTEVNVKGDTQYYQERACVQGGYAGWQFYSNK